MSGVSHRHYGHVPGADGLGKVKLYFKPKPPPRGYRKLGVVVYSAMFSLMALSFMWSREHLRYGYVIPAMRKILSLVDKFKGGSTEVAAIVGPSLDKALFYQGAAHATDRLMQMEIYRRTALGTLSEYYGNSTVESDKLYRSLQLRELAEQDYQHLPDEDREALNSYVNGINSRLATAVHGGTLPIDLQLLFGTSLNSSVLQPWRATDSLAVLRLLTYSWSTGWENQLAEALIARSAHMGVEDLWFSRTAEGGGFVSDQGVVQLPSAGSTAVAVSGSRSSTRGALLASSITSMASHQGLWYMSSLHVPGVLEVSGASVPGIPYVFVGRNKHLSWSFTQSTRRTEELYVDVASDTSDTAGATPAGLIQREETLKVRGEADLSFQVKSSPVGPVISDRLSPVIAGNIDAAKFGWRTLALQSDALSQRMSFSFLQGINTAREVTAFSAAVQELSAASLDFVFAGADGSVGIVASGRRVSTEAAQEDGAVMTGWRKLSPGLPISPVPDSIQSADGIIIAAESPDAATRIRGLLSNPASSISPNTLKMLLADSYSPTSQALGDLILRLAVGPQTGPSAAEDIRSAQAIIRAHATSGEPFVLLEAFRVVLAQNVLRPLGALANTAAGASVSAAHRLGAVSIRSEIGWIRSNLLQNTAPETTAWWRSKLRDADAVIIASLQDALEWCRASFGKDPSGWKWEVAHTAHYAHPNPKWFAIIDEVLSRGPAPMGGTVDSIARAGYLSYGGLLSPAALHNSVDTPVSSLRMVVDMADAACLWTQLPHTNSARLGSEQGQSSSAALARWSSDSQNGADAASAYQQMCTALPSSASQKKDEL